VDWREDLLVNYEIRSRRYSTVAYWVMFFGLFPPLLFQWIFGGWAEGLLSIFEAAVVLSAWCLLTVGSWARPNFPNSNPWFFFWLWGFICSMYIWIGFWDVFVPWATAAPKWLMLG